MKSFKLDCLPCNIYLLRRLNPCSLHPFHFTPRFCENPIFLITLNHNTFFSKAAVLNTQRDI